MSRVMDRLVIALATLIAIGTVLVAFFVKRLHGTEEVGLLNVPYMVAEHGRLAFPIYGYWFNAAYDKLFIHMPTHYFIVGVLMKLGIGLHYAEAWPTVFFILLSLALICTLPAEPPVRLGLTMGFGAAVAMLASMFPVDYFFHLRPDAHMATAWFAGLLTLEHARLRHWKNGPLFFGAALATYASTVHFSGVIGFTGVAAYVVLAWRDLPLRTWMQKLVVVTLGGLVAGGPFVFFYLIPSWSEIRSFTDAAQAQGDLLWTIKANFAVYGGFYASAMMHRHRTVDLLAAFPFLLVLKWSVPPFIAAALLLAVRRSTRVLAVSGMMVPLFVFLHSRRKLAQYLYPEMILVLVGFWVIVASACWWLAMRDRTGRVAQLLMPAVIGMFAVQLMVGTPALRAVKLTLTPRVHQMVIERAIGRAIVGPEALVASQLGLWYVSGASDWFDTTKDLLWNIPEEAPAAFWRRFDAVVCHLQSWGPTNTGWNEATLYRDKVLSLRAFYVTEPSAFMRGWTWFGADRPSAVQGYFWQDDTLQHFIQSPDGAYELVTGVFSGPANPTTPILGKIDEAVREVRPLFVTFMVLPQRSDRPNEQEYIFVLLAPSSDYRSIRETLRSRARLLDEVSGTVLNVDVSAVLETLHDRPMTFLRSHEEAFVRYAHPSQGHTSDANDPSASLALKNYAAGPDRTFTQESGQTVVTAARARFDWMVTTEPVEVQPEAQYLVTYDLRVDRGATAFHVMRGAEAKPLASFYREVPQSYTRESFVVYTGAGSPLRFVVTAFNSYRSGPVSFAIKNLRVVRVALSR